MKLNYLAVCAVLIAIAYCGHQVAGAETNTPAKSKHESPLTPGGVWRAGDRQRPKPRVVDPGKPDDCDGPAMAPSDAVVLIGLHQDGTLDLSAWQMRPRKPQGAALTEPTWKIERDYVEVVPGVGSLVSKEKFADCQIHVEWMTPANVAGSGQARGNSGVLLAGQCEIQILDSFENETYADGQAAAIYHRYPPLVNASRRPGEWQTFDIVFIAPKFDEHDANKIVAAAQLSLLHNGIVVHHAAPLDSRTREVQIVLQDHLNPVRFRNVWVRRLAGYDQ